MGNKTFSIRPFEKLKKKIETKQTAPPAFPSRRKKKEEYTDEELFTLEMDDVQEIEAFRMLACERVRRKAPAAARIDPDRETLDVLDAIAAGQRPIHLPDTQEYTEWVSPDYHETIIPKLHEGHFSVEAFLDLHGFTVLEADEELDLFLRECFQRGHRCVKIIHGRGLRSLNGPQVKSSVVRRLSGHFRKDVIAFVTARQCDGGLGALYVLLRKK